MPFLHRYPRTLTKAVQLVENHPGRWAALFDRQGSCLLALEHQRPMFGRAVGGGPAFDLEHGPYFVCMEV